MVHPDDLTLSKNLNILKSMAPDQAQQVQSSCHSIHELSWSKASNRPKHDWKLNGSAARRYSPQAGQCGRRRFTAVISRISPLARRLLLSVPEAKMLETILVLLVVLWLLGMVSSYTLGGFIHVLLVLAVVVFLFRVISGRRPV
jgi:hypothetical protein